MEEWRRGHRVNTISFLRLRTFVTSTSFLLPSLPPLPPFSLSFPFPPIALFFSSISLYYLFFLSTPLTVHFSSFLSFLLFHFLLALSGLHFLPLPQLNHPSFCLFLPSPLFSFSVFFPLPYSLLSSLSLSSPRLLSFFCVRCST